MSSADFAQQLKRFRAQFPLISQQPLTYLDNAATTQKPQVVIDALSQYYTQQNANVHRGAHRLSDDATAAFEAARIKVQQFINAADWREIIWTRGTTEAINLLAYSWGNSQLQAGDRILISAMEHHANIVPWQQLCQRTGAKLEVIPLTETGELDMHAFQQLLDTQVKLVAVTYISNVLGTLNPVKTITELAHQAGARVLIDGAQALAHEQVDVQALGCDFFVASAHKAYGPTGIGFLFGKHALLEAVPPWQFGGEMIRQVSFEKSTFNELPFRFEAGTPAIAEAIAFAQALQFLEEVDPTIKAHEQQCLRQLHDGLRAIAGVSVLGPNQQRRALVSFTLDGLHSYDVGQWLNQQGIAIRTGHHCAMPLMDLLGLPEGCARASLALYNTATEIDRFLNVLEGLNRPASAAIPTAKATTKLQDELAELKSWQDKLNLLTQRAQATPLTLADHEKTSDNQLHGCTTKVWLVHRWHPSEGILEFIIEADSKIIRGLALLVLELVNQQPPQLILELDIAEVFKQLGLSQHLSPSRNNGILAMSEAIKTIAQSYV